MAHVYILRHGRENKFKIGRTTKSVKVRLKELSTGNPDLVIFDVIETEHETTIEKYIHRRLATRKIINGSSSDEFYAVSPVDLIPVIDEARTYNSDCLPTIAQADDLDAEDPDGSVKEPGNEAIAMHHEMLEIEQQIARLQARQAYLIASIKITMGTASELRGIATFDNVVSNRFNSALFKAENPDLYDKYRSPSVSRVFKLEK